MLNYQSTSFHDALYVRKLLGLRCAPEFEDWLHTMGIVERGTPARPSGKLPAAFAQALARLQ
jgi:ethanolamine ammonia-lyase large subunit